MMYKHAIEKDILQAYDDITGRKDSISNKVKFYTDKFDKSTKE